MGFTALEAQENTLQRGILSSVEVLEPKMAGSAAGMMGRIRTISEMLIGMESVQGRTTAESGIEATRTPDPNQSSDSQSLMNEAEHRLSMESTI
jgi:hypothetical protein